MPTLPTSTTLEVATLQLQGVKIQGPLPAPRDAKPSDPWLLQPLAGANGSIRAKIVDAHLVFDADVTVPIREGRIDFNQATVEHVGPDSRMGVSRMGFYVDAPNGRSYLYQFSTPPVAGVQYEKSRGMFGPFTADRGHLELEPFVEWLLRQPKGSQFLGVTEQARLLFDRTAMSGEVRLGDGKFAMPGVQGEFAGRAEGRNVVRLHAEAVGRGVTLEVPTLLVRNAVVDAGGARWHCDEITASASLRLGVEGGEVRFTFELSDTRVSGLRPALPEPSRSATHG